MIDKEKINLDWTEGVSTQNRKADKILVEKVIHALLLLEGLAVQNLNFVFKGGTALMLHLNTPKRLSIDIDILMPSKPEKLDEQLDGIAKEQGFLRKELLQRSSNSKIQKAHYKFYFTPLHKTSRDEEYVLLDVHFEEVQYRNLVDLQIQSFMLPEKGASLTVKSASLEDLLGDKLTAFAPSTTGIPYFKGMDSKSMEIIKQLYDIGILFNHVTDLKTIKATYKRFAKTELTYRGLSNLSYKEALEDIYQTSLCIATRGADGKGDFGQLQKGIHSVSRFIFSESYHIEKAITHASKAAYLATLIKQDAESIEKYSSPLQMKDWFINKPMNSKLNRLKKSNPEAFFYWYKIYALKTIQVL